VAQTKSKSRSPSKSKSKKSTSSSSSRKSASSNGSNAKSRSRAGKPKAKRSRGGSNSSGSVGSAKQAVESTAKGAGQTAKQAGKSVGRAAGKAKVPLVAGGAALMGAAGGLAMGARSQRVRGLAKAMQRPKVKVKSRDVKHAAKEVGAMGAQMGRLASELQTAREESNGKHRSPIEVVLQGLTTRGTRR
jgi:hypothetical protein